MAGAERDPAGSVATARESALAVQCRVAIVDDEEAPRRGIRLLLDCDDEVEVVGECGDGRAAVGMIERTRPDILFLDVQMPELDGFEVLARVEAAIPIVIFVTAYDQYAIRAFEVHALDYLLKPFSDERFADALVRAKRRLHQAQSEQFRERIRSLLAGAPNGAAARRASPADRLVVRSKGRIAFVSVDEILWIEAADNYVRLHTAGRSHLLRETMANIESGLDPDRFVRVHRSTIVNLEHMSEIRSTPEESHVVLLADGTLRRVSQSGRERLEAVLGQPL